MKKLLVMLLVIGLVLSTAVSAVFAGNGNGNGDGSGGGSDEGLTLDEIVVNADSIVLTFSKNVVNIKVKDNNMTCFELKDANGNDVNFEVVMGDDQVDPDCKRIITIVPENYDASKTYTLTVKSNLTSKSGVSLTEDLSINLPTAEADTPASPAAGEQTTEDENPTQEKKSNAALYIIIALVVVGIGIVVIKKRK